MRFQGFIGPSYTMQSVNVDCQRCINLYPEMDEIGTGNAGEVASLVSTPGLKLLVTLPTYPVRGVYTDSTGHLWAVGGNTLYSISKTYAATSAGTLLTSSGPVSFADNGIEVVLVDGTYGYTFGVAGPASIYLFTISTSTTCNVGDIYSNNGNSYTVMAALAAQTGAVLFMSGTGAPSSTGTLTLVQGSNTPAITFSVAAAQAFTQITDSNFLGANQVTYMDGYLIFNRPNTQIFQLTPLNAVLPLSGLDLGSASAAPDNLVGLVALQENLYLFSQKHMEVFYDSGNNSFPFDRIQGAVLELGCLSAFSIAKIQNAVYWLGQDSSGRGVIYRAQGLQPQRISTFAIESEIELLGDMSTARSWSYQQAGHFFYCLNLPGANTTWVFDTTMNLWHERTFLAPGGTYLRHLADCHAFAYNTNVVGDYSSGNVYSLDPTVFTDNGSAICRERASPHLSKDMNRIFHSRFKLDMEMGLGLDGGVQGSNPQAMLQWSNDFGHSWSNEHWAGVGKIGARKTQAAWRRLGASRDRVYRVRITDPIKVTLLGAELDIDEGSA